MKPAYRLAVIVAGVIGCAVAGSHAGEPASQPAGANQYINFGIFDAKAFVIVKKAGGGHRFTVVETLDGELHGGDEIEVDTAQVVRVNDRGFYYTLPFTDSMRLLLCLVKDPKSGRWNNIGMTDCAETPDDIGRLRHVAEDSLAYRKEWVRILAIKDPKERVKALWPLMWDGTNYSYQRTIKELANAGTVAGDFVAGEFHNLDYKQRSAILVHTGQFGGQKLHKVVREFVKKRLADYEALFPNGPTAADVTVRWSDLPDEARDAYCEVVDGLAGLAKFGDESDLPFFRKAGTAAADWGHGQFCQQILHAFCKMPAKENIPVIERIWKALPDDRLLWPALPAALGALKEEGVPLLVQMMGADAPGAAREVRDELKRTVGKDLGPDPKPWLEWCEKQRATTVSPITQPATRP